MHVLNKSGLRLYLFSWPLHENCIIFSSMSQLCHIYSIFMVVSLWNLQRFCPVLLRSIGSQSIMNKRFFKKKTVHIEVSHNCLAKRVCLQTNPIIADIALFTNCRKYTLCHSLMVMIIETQNKYLPCKHFLLKVESYSFEGSNSTPNILKAYFAWYRQWPYQFSYSFNMTSRPQQNLIWLLVKCWYQK